MRGIASSDFDVEWVYATRLDANEYLALGDLGKRSFGENEWPVMTFEHKASHE